MHWRGSAIMRLPESDAAPSSTDVRPFALRFARPFDDTPSRVATVPAYRYDPVRQIAVVADGSDVPVFKHINPKTEETTGTPDGAKPGDEETRSDWQTG